jgi:NTP pyrophosphatase (non-canonical NTP hydrolase)
MKSKPYTDMQEITIKLVDEVLQELNRAEEKHPNWNYDYVYMTAILAEEVGEAIKEAVDIHITFTGKRKNKIAKLRKELIQSAAMCFRSLISIEEKGEYK